MNLQSLAKILWLLWKRSKVPSATLRFECRFSLWKWMPSCSPPPPSRKTCTPNQSDSWNAYTNQDSTLKKYPKKGNSTIQTAYGKIQKNIQISWIKHQAFGFPIWLGMWVIQAVFDVASREIQPCDLTRGSKFSLLTRDLWELSASMLPTMLLQELVVLWVLKRMRFL